MTTTANPTPSARSRWVSFRAAARHFGVDARTISRAVEKNDVEVIEFTPRCYRVNLDELQSALSRGPTD